MNFSSVSPSHRVQSFRNRLLQHGSPTGSQVLPTKLRGLLSPRVHRSWQDPAPAWALHGVTASFGHPPAPAWGPPWAAPPWGSKGCRGTACLTVVFTTGCRDISSLVPGLPLAPASSLTLVSAELFLPHILTHHLGCSCSLAGFFPLTMLSQRHYHHCSRTHPLASSGRVHLGCSWHWLYQT